MIKIGAGIGNIVSISMGIIVAVTVLFFITKGWEYAPCVEGWLLPVVEFNLPIRTTRTNGRACFTMNITKLRAAVPVKYEMLAEVPKLSPKIPVPIEMVDDKDKPISNDWENHPVGETWPRRYCFSSAAAGIDKTQTISMTGAALHYRHPFYLTQTPIPHFDIKPER